MSQSFQYDVFLSQTVKDKAVVRPPAEWSPVAVRQHLKVWIGERENKPGAHLPARRLLAWFAGLLVLQVALVNGAPGFREENGLSITIILPRDDAHNAILPHGEAFEVCITNHSAQSLRIWEEMCQPGHRTLTFAVKRADGDGSIVQKRDVPADAWTQLPPRTRIIPPKGSQTRKVNFSEIF